MPPGLHRGGRGPGAPYGQVRRPVRRGRRPGRRARRRALRCSSPRPGTTRSAPPAPHFRTCAAAGRLGVQGGDHLQQRHLVLPPGVPESGLQKADGPVEAARAADVTVARRARRSARAGRGRRYGDGFTGAGGPVSSSGVVTVGFSRRALARLGNEAHQDGHPLPHGFRRRDVGRVDDAFHPVGVALRAGRRRRGERPRPRPRTPPRAPRPRLRDATRRPAGAVRWDVAEQHAGRVEQLRLHARSG
ncbi:hypothetical protein SALBM217S_06250 [Streptomyces griseoloalbus]